MASQVVLSLSLKVDKATLHGTALLDQLSDEQALQAAAAELVHILVGKVGPDKTNLPIPMWVRSIESHENIGSN